MDKVIQSTKEYHKIKLNTANRPVQQNKLETLIKAIRTENHLADYPIVLNKKMEVMDGQHRFLAAQAVGTEIYYIISKELDIEDVASTNSLQTKWTAPDYIHHYAILGKPDYIYLRDKIKEWGIPDRVAFELFGIVGSVWYRTMVEGRLTINPVKREMAGKVLIYLEIFKGVFPQWKNKFFIRALRRFSAHKRYDHSRMTRKLLLQPNVLVNCATVEQYMQLLQEIYNWRESDKVNFMF